MDKSSWSLSCALYGQHILIAFPSAFLRKISNPSTRPPETAYCCRQTARKCTGSVCRHSLTMPVERVTTGIGRFCKSLRKTANQVCREIRLGDLPECHARQSSTSHPITSVFALHAILSLMRVWGKYGWMNLSGRNEKGCVINSDKALMRNVLQL